MLRRKTDFLFARELKKSTFLEKAFLPLLNTGGNAVLNQPSYINRKMPMKAGMLSLEVWFGSVQLVWATSSGYQEISTPSASTGEGEGACVTYEQRNLFCFVFVSVSTFLKLVVACLTFFD